MLCRAWSWIWMAAFAPAVLSAVVNAPKPPEKVCVQGGACVSTAAGVQATSAAAFIDSIGVNVHFNQVQTAYVARYALVKQKLFESGIVHARDGAVDARGGFPAKDQAATFRELGAAGIRFTYLFKANVSREFVQGYPEHVAPAFEAYEFPNELNANKNSDWAGTLRAWAPVFQSYVRSGETSAGYPIIGPSLIDLGDDPYGALGDLSSYVDAGNIHSYYVGNPATNGWGGPGVPPCDVYRYGSTAYKQCNAARVCGTKPVIFTETGWGTDLTKKNHVPESIQAKYLVRMLLLHFAAGIPRTFIYQLVDAGTDSGYSFGLVTETGREKPAYTEIKSLIGIMRDDTDTVVDAPGSLGFSLSGATNNVRSALFQKSNGAFLLILWIETPGFDNKAVQPITVPAQSVKLTLNAAAAARTIHSFRDDGTAKTATQPRSASGDYVLTLTDNLTVVEIRP